MSPAAFFCAAIDIGFVDAARMVPGMPARFDAAAIEEGRQAMAWLDSPHDARRTMRVRANGSARLHCGPEVVRGHIHDAATGGVNIRADVPLGTAHLRGRSVKIDLHFDRGAANHFVLEGRVLRVAVATRTVVVAFDAIPCDYEDFIQDALLALEHERAPCMILVDVDRSRRGTIAGTFRIAGCEVTEVDTPLDAIARLARLDHQPELVAISDEFPESVAEDLRDLMSTMSTRT
jgi:hypothetical protein